MTTCPGDFAAEGTDPAGFTSIAGIVLLQMSGGSIDAFELTRKCITEAITLCPTAVGWPMDLRVSESGSVNNAVHLRLDPSMPMDFLKLAESATRERLTGSCSLICSVRPGGRLWSVRSSVSTDRQSQ